MRRIARLAAIANARVRRPTAPSPAAPPSPHRRRAPHLLGSVLLALTVAGLPASASAAPAPAGIQQDRFLDVSGESVFVLGANYEGPAHHAWTMWRDGVFDPGLIAQDMARARSANLSVLRVFLQQPLADDIAAERWEKLDAVLDLADQHGLKLILTFADYPEVHLADLVAVDAAVAARYRDRPTIFAYDLQNEPRFGDLALTVYPPGTYVALQDPALVPLVGEVVPRHEIAAYRASEEGRRSIPTRLTDDQAWVYASVLAAYVRFLEEAENWARERRATVVDYLFSPDSAHWNPLKHALNDTLATWMRPRLEALRAADPSRPITIGHVDPILASLAANNWLDYRTIHRYPGASERAIELSMELFDDIRDAVPGRPLVLGEFGFSNAGLDEERSARLEVAMVQAFREIGGAGALKWMLNDFPLGFNPRENNFGMFRGDGSPKPVVAAFQALGTLRPSLPPPEQRPLDYDIPNGHFFTQANGKPLGADTSGYAVTNDDGIAFWDAFQRLGGVEAVGYPVSRRFVLDGFVVQVMQKAIFQWRPEQQEVWLLNTFDRLHEAGKDGWLEVVRQTPPPFDTSPDTGKTWDEVVARHLAMLDGNPAVKARFLSEPDWLNRFGLPVSVADYRGVYVVRAQRVVLQQWKVDTPWARAGDITVANGGDIAKEAGLIPASAMVPEPAP